MRLFQDVKRYYKSFLLVCKIGFIQFYQLLGVFIIAYINNRPWESILLLFGYGLLKAIIEFLIRKHKIKEVEPVHTKSTTLCTVLTWAVFYALTKIIPDYSISTIIQPLLGFGLAYYSYYIGSLKKRAEK